MGLQDEPDIPAQINIVLWGLVFVITLLLSLLPHPLIHHVEYSDVFVAI